MPQKQLVHRVKRRGADSTIDDAERPDGQGRQAALRPLRRAIQSAIALVGYNAFAVPGGQLYRCGVHGESLTGIAYLALRFVKLTADSPRRTAAPAFMRSRWAEARQEARNRALLGVI